MFASGSEETMRLFRNIIHIVLVLTILSTGLPLYHPADMNRDGEVGLTDAIVSVRRLAGAATGEGAFRDGMENTLTSLSVAAGLKRVIRTGRDPGSETSVPALSAFMITSSHKFEALPPALRCAADRSLLYNSPMFVPLTPPPRTGLA
jgi:hypothetical protein